MMTGFDVYYQQQSSTISIIKSHSIQQDDHIENHFILIFFFFSFHTNLNVSRQQTLEKDHQDGCNKGIKNDANWRELLTLFLRGRCE